jgi:hypothetical protein
MVLQSPITIRTLEFHKQKNLFTGIEEMVVQRAITIRTLEFHRQKNQILKKKKKKKRKGWVGIGLSSYPMHQFLKTSYHLRFISALYEITIHQLYNQLMVNFCCNYPMKFKPANW